MERQTPNPIGISELHSVLNVTPQGLHHIVRTMGLDTESSKYQKHLPPIEVRKLFTSRGYQYHNETIAFSVVKGGVGKTSLSHSFAVRASQYGARVLVVDLDQQANMTQAFGVEEDDLPSFYEIIHEKIHPEQVILPITPHLDLIPSTMNMSFLDRHIQVHQENLQTVFGNPLNAVADKYDYIVLDCPPAISSVTSAATLTSSRIVLPVIPMKFALHGLKTSFSELAHLEEKFGNRKLQKSIVFNRYDARKSSSSEYLSQLAGSKYYKKHLMNCFIRECSEMENHINRRRSVFDFKKRNNAREDMDLFTRELMFLNESAFLH